MHRARAFETNRKSVLGRGADQSALRPTPLTLVSGAVAGDDLRSLTASVAQALGRAVAIAIPALGEPVVCPAQALSTAQVQQIADHAAAAVAGTVPASSDVVADAVLIRIGERVVGIVAAGAGEPDPAGAAEQRYWLEAAAAAASVNALIRDAPPSAPEDSRAALVSELEAGPVEDLPGWLARARRVGVELGNGGTALCAQRSADSNGRVSSELAGEHDVLLAESPRGRILGLVPSGADAAELLAERLRSLAMTVAVSAPRRDPAHLHEALHEAELLVALADLPGVARGGQDETYRLLIGVLLRDAEELIGLRLRTISPLADYDSRHDTDLLATLQAFLAHDGSTTETAEAMKLHRHTVGYRLSRVQEVSGLSPYESDGRELLSLGLKAHQILTAAEYRGRR